MARKQVQATGPIYRALEDSFIDGVLVRAGQETPVYHGLPGKALEPVNAEAEAVVKQVEALEKAHAKGKLTPEQFRDAKLSLSNELNEVDTEKRRRPANYDEPLSDAERAVLERHALAAVESTKAKDEDDTNRTTVKLQGQNEETEASLQGATPVTDKGSSKK
jgi:hypothetical protein